MFFEKDACFVLRTEQINNKTVVLRGRVHWSRDLSSKRLTGRAIVFYWQNHSYILNTDDSVPRILNDIFMKLRKNVCVCRL